MIDQSFFQELKNKNRTKYDILPLQPKAVGPRETRPVGFALQYEGENYYVVKLWMFPRCTYFLAKNRESQSDYTLYTKCIRDQDGARFQNPAGFGRLDAETKSQLKIDLDLIGSSVAMNLFPTE